MPLLPIKSSNTPDLILDRCKKTAAENEGLLVLLLFPWVTGMCAWPLTPES